MLKGGEKAGRGLRNEKKGAKRRKKEKRGPTFQFFLSVSCFFFFFFGPFYRDFTSPQRLSLHTAFSERDFVLTEHAEGLSG